MESKTTFDPIDYH